MTKKEQMDTLSKNLSNAFQFFLIFIGFVCMGSGCGFERSLLPRMAIQTFNQIKASTRLQFVATFGLSKAIANAFSGPIADRFGRKPILVAGCLLALPVMPFVIIAKTWNGITIMNGAFGLSQGFLGSSLFFLLIDLMGPQRRGVAVGIGESTIYVSTAVINILAGRLASKYGYRPVPFYVATGFCVVGLLATVPLTDTLDQVRAEQSASEKKVDERTRRKYARMMSTQPSHMDEELVIPTDVSQHTMDGYVSPWSRGPSTVGSLRSLLSKEASYLEPVDEETRLLGSEEEEESVEVISVDKHSLSDNNSWMKPHIPSCDASVISHLIEPISSPLQTLAGLILNNPSYVALCLGGFALNFKDGFAWGTFPTYFKYHELSDPDTDLLVAIYPLCWGFAQAFMGYLSDHFGRKLFLIAGMGSCAVAMAMYALPNRIWGIGGNIPHTVFVFECADVLLGLGTAFAYPALQAGAADEADPINRGLALGFYRFIRDMGYVVGALVCGQLTDMIGYDATFLVNAAVMALALLLMIFIYREKSEGEMALAISVRIAQNAPELLSATQKEWMRASLNPQDGLDLEGLLVDGGDSDEEETAEQKVASCIIHRTLVNHCSDSL